MGMETERDFVNMALRGVERESRDVIAGAVRKAMASAWETGVRRSSYVDLCDGVRRVYEYGRHPIDLGVALKHNPYVDNAEVPT